MIQKIQNSKFAKFSMVFLLTTVLFITSYSQTSIIGTGENVNPLYKVDDQSTEIEKAAFPGMLLAAAEVIGVAYAAGYVVGTIAHHAWDRFIINQDPTNESLKDLSYVSTDFSQFDNI